MSQSTEMDCMTRSVYCDVLLNDLKGRDIFTGLLLCIPHAILTEDPKLIDLLNRM